MRLTLFAAIASLAMLAAPGAAAADPYRWCAVLGGSSDDAGTNCYFVTLEQCRATVSGVGGFCTVNQFYDGRPVVTPGPDTTRRKRTR